MANKEELRKMVQERTKDTSFLQKQSTDIFNLFINDIVIDSNIRENISLEGITELADNIRKNGLLNPITVYKPDNESKYKIIAGHRRFLACKEIGLQTIPSLIKRTISEEDRIEIQLVENIYREDLSTYEKAKAIRKLLEVRYANIYNKDVKELDTNKILSKLFTINNKIEASNLHDLKTLDNDEKELIKNLGIKTRQLIRYIIIFDFNEEIINIIKNNSNIPLNLIEFAYQYKNNDFAINIFKDYIENGRSVKEIKLKYKKIVEKHNDKQKQPKKRIRIKSKLASFNKNIAKILLEEDVIIKDKDDMLKELDEISENIRKIKEKYIYNRGN